MKPIVTVEEMHAIDRDAPVAETVLIERAGWHVARVAKEMLGGLYGRRIVVIAGPGNNGADGRVAAQLLQARGAGVQIVAPGELTAAPTCDLVIDAAFGTGFRGDYVAPPVGSARLLSVDIPSGVNGDTGEACPGAVRADVTVTFAAYKPGQFLGAGADLAGDVRLYDIGLNAAAARMHLVESSDVAAALVPGRRDSQKWNTAVAVVAGSPGMQGAAHLSSAAAARAGAGMVRLAMPGVAEANLPVGEAVAVSLPKSNWDNNVLEIAERVRAVVIGPGLGRDPQTVECVRRVVEQLDAPLLIDADGLFALGAGKDLDILRHRKAPTVLTPHDGEFARLNGGPPGADRISAVRTLAEQTNSVVLAKGSTTVVCTPDGKVLISNTGGPRLATAGTGDVLSGIIGAFLARGLDAHSAAAYGAHVHGLAAQRGYSQGLVAGDLPELVARVLTNQSINEGVNA